MWGAKRIFSAATVFFFLISCAHAWEDRRLELWVKNLKNENVLIRKGAARNLGVLGEKRAIPYLVKALQDKEIEVRSEICNTLGILGDESVKGVLKKILYKDPSPKVRQSAKKAIDNIDAYVALQKEKKLKELKEKMQTKTVP